ncbi:hypothetical protein V8F20_011136 [Naviculisporaceae sp. PSN 640]
MTDDDLKRLNFELLIRSPAFERLSSRLNSRFRFNHHDAHCLYHIRRRAEHSYEGQNWSRLKFPLSARANVKWDPRDFIVEQGYEQGPQSLGKALTITGSTSKCQVLSCLDYAMQVWPITGGIVIEAIIEACDNASVTIKKLIPDGTEIWIKSSDRELNAHCTGLLSTIIEVLEVLAWAGAALRQSSISSGVQYSVPYLEYMAPASQFPRIPSVRFRYDTESLSLADHRTDWCCWHSIFRNPVIVKGFPTLHRPADMHGLELSLEGLATLIGAPKLTLFQKSAIFKGFNSAITAVEVAEDHVKWHFYMNEDGTRLPCSDPRLHSDWNRSVHLTWNELKKRRHFLGWSLKGCSPLANYSIGWSSPEFVGSGCALEKVAISGSTGFLSLGAEFSLGRKDKSPSIKRGMDAYFDTLNSLLSSYVVFYDVSDQRAWLTNAMHALLHLVRASLKHDSESEFASNYMLKHLADLEEDLDPGDPKAAIRFLSNRSNLEKLLFPNPDDLRTEETKITTAASSNATPAETSTAEIRTSTGVRLKDRIQQIIYVLEQTIDHQANAHSFAAPGVPLKLTPRETLEGYRFMDLAARTARALTPRMVKLTTYNGAGKSWVDFTRAIRAVTLFGEGFGELLSLPQDSVTPALGTDINTCANWKYLPTGKDYLAVSTYDLARILKQEGSTAEYPLIKIAPGVFWQKPDTVFNKCACLKDKQLARSHFLTRGHDKSCDRVQAILPPAFLPKKKQRQPVHDPVLASGGAVVFGRSERFPLKWPDRGEPKREKSSHGPPNPSASTGSQGLTSSVPVPDITNSMTSLSLANIAASPSSATSSTGVTNTATPPASTSISTPLTDDAASISTTATSPRMRKRQRLWNMAKSFTGS